MTPLFAQRNMVGDDGEHRYRQHHSTEHHKTSTEQFTSHRLWITISITNSSHWYHAPIHARRYVVKVRIFLHVHIEEVDETAAQYDDDDNAQKQRGVHVRTGFDGQTYDAETFRVFGETEETEDAEYLTHVLETEDVIWKVVRGLLQGEHDKVREDGKEVDPREKTLEESGRRRSADETTHEVQKKPDVQTTLPDGEWWAQVDFGGVFEVG